MLLDNRGVFVKKSKFILLRGCGNVKRISKKYPTVELSCGGGGDGDGSSSLMK